MIALHLARTAMNLVYSFKIIALFAAASFCSRVSQPEKWMIPDIFGYFSVVSENGLVGFWGLHWHQLLRFDFLKWSRWTLTLLPVRYRKAKGVRPCIYFFASFALSGAIHACGSYTQFNDTNEPHDIFILALVRAIGIGFQQGFSTVVLSKCPRAIQRPAVPITSYTWL